MMLRSLWSLLQKKGDRVIRLFGEKCTLRTFVESDAKQLAELHQNNKYYWATHEPLHRDEYYTEETQFKKILESIHMLHANREFSFGIYSKNSQKLIGHISLYAIKRLPYSSAFIGYSVDKNYIGKGIATEAANLVLEFAFQTINIHRIEAYVSPKNEGSIRVLEKAGLQREGLLRELLFINGEWEDHFMYAILQNDFKKISARRKG